MNSFKKMILSLCNDNVLQQETIKYSVAANGIGQGFQLYDVTNSVSLIDTNNENAYGDFNYIPGNVYKVSVFAFVDTGFTAMVNMIVTSTDNLTNITEELYNGSDSSTLVGTSVIVEYTFTALSGINYNVFGSAISGEM